MFSLVLSLHRHYISVPTIAIPVLSFCNFRHAIFSHRLSFIHLCDPADCFGFFVNHSSDNTDERWAILIYSANTKSPGTEIKKPGSNAYDSKREALPRCGQFSPLRD